MSAQQFDLTRARQELVAATYNLATAEAQQPRDDEKVATLQMCHARWLETVTLLQSGDATQLQHATQLQLAEQRTLQEKHKLDQERERTKRCRLTESDTVHSASVSDAQQCHKLEKDQPPLNLDAFFPKENWVKPTVSGNRHTFQNVATTPETEVQKRFSEVFASQIAEAAKNKHVFWADKSAVYWLHSGDDNTAIQGKAPDGVATADFESPPKAKPSVVHVVSLIDVKAKRGVFSANDKGKLYNDCIRVLEQQRWREEIFAALWDGAQAQILRVFRVNQPRTRPSFKAQNSATLNICKNPDHARLFATFMQARAEVGYKLDFIPSEARDFIGQGASSYVFTDEDCQKVYKVARDPDWNFGSERTMMQRAKSVLTIQECIDPENTHDRVLVLAPVLAPFCSKNKAALLNILVELKGLHKAGVVHGDIRLPNIMMHADKATLVDLGAARAVGAAAAEFQHGSLATGSDKVLRAVASGKAYQLTPQDDLVSFVRCIIMVQSDVGVPPKKAGNDTVARAQELLAFWAAQSQTTFAQELLTMCAAENAYQDIHTYLCTLDGFQQQVAGGASK